MSPMYIAKIINLLAIIFRVRWAHQYHRVRPRDGTNNKINNILPARLHKTSVRDI